MKYLKICLLLLLIAINQCVGNLETSTNILRFHRKFGVQKKFQASTHKSKVQSHIKSLSTKISKSHVSLQRAMARVKFVFSIFSLVVNLVLKVGSDIMTHFINKMNEETRDIMKKEHAQNSDTLLKMKTREIESCATIKLIIQSNKHFFLLSKFKSIYFVYYQARLADFEFHKILNRENLLIFLWVTQTVDDLVLVRDEFSKIETELLESLADIENDLCSQEVSYNDFQERNDVLDGKINQMEKLLEEKEDSFFGILFTEGISGVKIYFEKNFVQKVTGIMSYAGDQGENFQMQADYEKELLKKPDEAGNPFGQGAWSGLSDTQTEKKVDWEANQITKTVGRFGSAIGSTKDLIDSIISFHKANSKFEGWGKIIASAAFFLANIANLINNFVPGGELGVITGLLAAVFELFAKLAELVVAGVKFYDLYKKDKTSPDYLVVKDEFWKKAIEAAVALVKLCFSGFGGLVNEGLTFFKKIGDLITAYRRTRQQTLEMNFYKTLADLKIKEQENTNKFKICLANLLTMKSQFSTILEMGETEEFFQNNFSKNINGQSIIGEAIAQNPTNANFFETKGVFVMQKEVKKICDTNVQFCSRYFKKELFTQLKFSRDEINHYINLSTMGPYTDLVVSSNPGTSISFVKLGYEPIAENIYGCRMCSKNYFIRHVKVLSDSDIPIENKLERENLAEQKTADGQHISKKLYNDLEGENDPDYSEIKILRLDEKHHLYYETIHPTNLNEPKLVLSRLLYYPLKKPLDSGYNKDSWMPAIQVELSYFNLSTKYFVQCPGGKAKCDAVDANDVSIVITFPKPIENGDKLNLVWQSQFFGYKSTSNLLMVPVGGRDEKYNPEYLLERKNNKNFLYFVYNKSPDSQQTVPYLKHHVKTPINNSMKFSLISDIKIIPYRHNWIIKEGTIPFDLMREGLNSIVSSVSVEKINIERDTDIPKTNQTGVDSTIDFYIVQFEPFSLKDQGANELESNMVNTDCSSVCEQPGSNTSSNTCASNKTSFNSWKKLEENSGAISNMKNLDYPYNFAIIETGKILVKKSDDNWSRNSFYEIALSTKKGSEEIKNFDFDDKSSDGKKKWLHFFHIKLIDFDDDDDELEKYRGEELEKRKSEITASNKSKYLIIQKTLINDERKYDKIGFYIKYKSEVKDTNLINPKAPSIAIKLGDIEDDIYVLATTNKSEITNYFKYMFLAMKGYTILHRIILRKNNPNNVRFLLVLVKTTPGSGHLPTVDMTSSTLQPWVKDRDCKENIYSTISEKLCIKGDNINGNCINPRAFDYYEFPKKNTNKEEPFSFYYKDFSSINLTKVMFRKLYPNQNMKIDARTFFSNSLNTDLMKDCKEIDFTYPIKFRQSKQEKQQNLYRTLRINPDNSIDHVLSPSGPGIKGIYWLSISSTEKISKISKKNLEQVLASGFSYFRKIEWEYYRPKDDKLTKLYVTIYVNYDFRIKIDKEEICNLCQKVEKKMSSPQSTSQIDMNAITRAFSSESVGNDTHLDLVTQPQNQELSGRRDAIDLRRRPRAIPKKKK